MIEMKRTRQDKAEKNIERIKKNPQKEKALLDNPKKSRFSLSNLSKKQKISLIIGVIFLILVIVFSFLFFFRKPERPSQKRKLNQKNFIQNYLELKFLKNRSKTHQFLVL